MRVTSAEFTEWLAYWRHQAEQEQIALERERKLLGNGR